MMNIDMGRDALFGEPKAAIDAQGAKLLAI